MSFAPCKAGARHKADESTVLWRLLQPLRKRKCNTVLGQARTKVQPQSVSTMAQVLATRDQGAAASARACSVVLGQPRDEVQPERVPVRAVVHLAPQGQPGAQPGVPVAVAPRRLLRRQQHDQPAQRLRVRGPRLSGAL